MISLVLLNSSHNITQNDKTSDTYCITVMVVHDGTCLPSVALKCLQDSHLSQMDPFSMNQICR